jgi:hypothetical protein
MNGNLKNPNEIFKMNESKTMSRIFQFENLLHFLTIIFHIFVLLPSTSNYLLISGKIKNWFQKLIKI